MYVENNFIPGSLLSGVLLSQWYQNPSSCAKNRVLRITKTCFFKQKIFTASLTPEVTSVRRLIVKILPKRLAPLTFTAPLCISLRYSRSSNLGFLPYGLHRLQGSYPLAITLSRLPVNSSLLDSFICPTEEQPGLWNFFVLVFRM